MGAVHTIICICGVSIAHEHISKAFSDFCIGIIQYSYKGRNISTFLHCSSPIILSHTRKSLPVRPTVSLCYDA